MRNKVSELELEMNLEFESYELKCSKSSFFNSGFIFKSSPI